MVDVTTFPNEVWARLMKPRARGSFVDLAGKWQTMEIECRISGYGVLQGHDRLLSDLRGSIGRALMAGASQNSLNEKPCTWSPPCANDVLFGAKPALKVGRHSHVIPKPFVLQADVDRQDLLLRVVVIGFADEWSNDIKSALLGAIRERMEWEKLAGRLFVPRDLQVTVRQQQCQLRDIDQGPAFARMQFLTPVDCKNTDPVDNPTSLISRLASRLFLLARWQEMEIEVDWRELSDAWRALKLEVRNHEKSVSTRDSRRTSTRFIVEGRLIDLEISGDLTLIWPLLVMGETSHLGRGTVAGMGRYVLM